MRRLFNLFLTVGYILGFGLVWLGIEMLIFERQQLATALLSIVIGLAVWLVLIAIGKRSLGVSRGGGATG